MNEAMTFCGRDQCNVKDESDRTCKSTSPCRVPWHYRIHRAGVHLESCCGVCNLFPGVIIIAISQIVLGGVLLIPLLNNEDYYDKLHESTLISIVSGGVLSAAIGAGALLLFVAFSDNGRLMMVYLFVAAILWIAMITLAIFKIAKACWKFRDVHSVNDPSYRQAHLACTTGLFCFFVCVMYLFGFAIVFSFYHFRYVRRAIYMHEAQCACA